METIVAVSKNQVYLMQGQSLLIVDEIKQAMPEIEQRVVVARDVQSAMNLIGNSVPEFRVVGYATLKEYEDTAAKLRATLNGVDTGWILLVEPGFG